MSLENTGAPNGAADSSLSSGESTSATSTSAAPSMDDTILSAYRQSMGKVTRDEGGEGGAADALADGLNTDGTTRARGPDGKFLPKANDAAPVDPTVTDTVTATETPPAAAKPHDTPPNTWTKEAKANWATLPESARQEIHRREADFHKGIGQYKDAAGFGSQMAQELLPYQQTLSQHGIHPREVVKTLAPIWNTLVTGSPQEKAQVVLQVIKDFGIDITSLGTEAQQSTPAATQEDPRLAAALQRIDKLEGHLTTQERQRAEAEFSAHVETVNKFGADPKRPHFNAVRDDMAALIESGRAADLAEAYDKAIWINPEVRASLLAEQEKERVIKAAEQAAAARKAAGANVTRRGTPPVTPKPGTIEDTIRREYRSRHG